MPRSRRLFCLAAAALLTAGWATPAPAQHRPEEGIVVSGTGRVSVAPDTAVLTLGVDSQAATLADATADAARRMSAVLARVKGLGVADADIATVSYSVDPRTAPPDPARRDDPPRIVGYHVSNLAQVTVKKLPDAGRILDAAVAAGANAVRGIRFTLADPSKAQAQARAGAVADALAKARELAAAAGVKPGDVLTIREMGGSPPVPVRTMAMRMEAGTPVEAGQLDVVVTVELRQAIQR
jgi:uncharacterized protein YggE